MNVQLFNDEPDATRWMWTLRFLFQNWHLVFMTIYMIHKSL